MKGSEEAIFDLESEISRNEVQKASCSANQQCLCNLERFEVREAHWTANQSRCEGAECKPRKIGGKQTVHYWLRREMGKKGAKNWQK